MAFGRSTLELLISAKDNASKVFAKIGSNFQTNADRMVKAGKGMVIAGTAITAAFGVAIKQAAAFQAQMAQVSTMLDKNTMKHMPAFEKAVKDMSMEFGEGTDTLSKGLYDILSASIPAEKAISVLDVSVRAAKAGLTDTGVAADAITTILNSYGLSADKATSVSDLLFATVKRGKITFAELAPNIGKVSATAAKFGMSMEELGATIATLTRSGIRAELAMTAIRGVLNGVVGATEESSKAFKEKLGIELTTATLKSEGFINILKRMKEAGLTPEDIKKMFPNVRGLTGIIATMGDLEGVTNDYNLMVNRAGLTQEAFEKNTNTTQIQLSKLKQGLNLVAVEIGTQLLPHVNKLIDGVLGLIKKFREMDPSFKRWIAYAGSLSGILLTVGGSVLMLTGKLFKLAGAIKAAGLAGKATTAGIAGSLTVLAALAIALAKATFGYLEMRDAQIKASEANAKAASKQAEANTVLLEKFFEIKKSISELPPEMQKNIEVTDEMRKKILALASDSTISTEVRKQNEQALNEQLMKVIGTVGEYRRAHQEATVEIVQSKEKEEEAIVRLGEKEKAFVESVKQAKQLARASEFEQKMAQIAEDEQSALLQAEKEIENVQMLEEAKKQIKDIFREERLIAEEENKTILLEKEQEQNARILEMEQELDNSLKELSQNEFDNKVSLLEQEYNARVSKIQKEVKDEQKRTQLLLKNEQLFNKQKEKIDKERAVQDKALAREKVINALDTAQKSVQAINYVLEAEGSSAKKRKQLMLFLIGLEKALAIAKMWSAEASKGLLGIATATLGTARIVAEFATIKKSLKAAEAPSMMETKPIEIEPIGGGARPTLATVEEGAVVAGEGVAPVSAPVAAGIAGGGQTTINVGGVTVNIDVEKLEEAREPERLEFLMREIAEAIKSKTVEATRMAQQSFILGKELEEEAV